MNANVSFEGEELVLVFEQALPLEPLLQPFVLWLFWK
jgi:hypothetical protein